MAKVTIDGIEVEVQDGINVIEAAKAADVHVPHFCYHPSLSIVGQCLFYFYGKPVIRQLNPGQAFTGDGLEALAAHITAFSLAALQQD